MVNITVLEVHLDDASFSASADRPFSSTGSDAESEAEEADDEQGDDQVETPDWTRTDDDEGTAVPTRALAAVGVLLVLVGLAAAVKRLVGGDEPEVDIETPGDDENRPVGVTVDE
jgi:hypothetical protein